MVYKNLVSSFVRSWNFTRLETYEILESLSDEKLQFQPYGEKWQPLFWEFGCIARTQIVYTEAVITGKMNFSLFASESLPKKTDYQTKDKIRLFLERTNIDWIDAIRGRRRDENLLIKWPGFNKPLMNHIASLAEHERLHHGQFISYFTLAGFELPKNFKENWEL